jgi:hypothetical protein
VRCGIITADDIAPLAIVRLEAGVLACKNLGTMKLRGIIYEGRMLELREAEARTALNALHFFPKNLGYKIGLEVLDFIEAYEGMDSGAALYHLKTTRKQAVDCWIDKRARRLHLSNQGVFSLSNSRLRNLYYLYNHILGRIALRRSPVLQLRALASVLSDKEMYELIQPPTAQFVLERIESFI